VLNLYEDGSLKNIEEIGVCLGYSRKVISPIIKNHYSSKELKERKLLRLAIIKENRLKLITPTILKWFKDSLDTTTSEQLGKRLKIRRSKIKQIVLSTYSKEEWVAKTSLSYSRSKAGELNPMKNKFGELHHNFIGELLTENGYIQCLKPNWFAGKTGSKYVFKHHIVICENLGMTEIPLGFEVHHVDFDKTHNSIKNLALLTRAAHARLHSKSQIYNKLTMWELHEFMTWKSKMIAAS